jgi:acyl-CoA synthetase (AMP-forming)/AMP-acid ligase II
MEMQEKLQCPVVVRYASTEGCLATGTRLDDDIETICTTVGRPNGGVKIRIVATDGSECAQNEVGTVQLHSRARMRGYWKDPELTSQSITPDDWLITGDLGRVDAAGNLHLAGRGNEMYIRGGYNVYPIEIENVLGTHSDIVSSAVLGASVSDRLGEIGVLFAVARSGATLELSAIRSFVQASLANYKAPDILVVVAELPLTSLGKVDKKQLQPTADQEAAQWSR